MLNDRKPTIEVAILGRKVEDAHIRINASDFNPEIHMRWEDFLFAETGKKVDPPPPSRRGFPSAVEAAESLADLHKLADGFGLVLPKNITNVETAKKRLLAQLAKEK